MENRHKIRCPGGPDARLLSVASWDKGLLSQYNKGAPEVPLEAAEGDREIWSTSVILLKEGEDPMQANQYCSVLIEQMTSSADPQQNYELNGIA